MSKRMRSEWRWVRAPQGGKGPAIPDALKEEVTELAQAVVEEWKPRYIKEPPKDGRFNYIIDLYTKWHGKSLYFCATYACPGPTAISPSFESRFSRLEYTGGRRFNMAYMRHTGKWVTVAFGQTLEECSKALREDPWYQPS
jgi:hypothetical protein